MNPRKSFIIFLSVAGVIIVIVMIIGLLTGKSGEEEANPWLSTFSTKSSGFKALYLMLADLNIPVRHLKTEISLASGNAQSMWILSPFVVPEKERDKLKDWVASGNTLVITAWKFSLLKDKSDATSPKGVMDEPNSELPLKGNKNLARQVDRVFCFSGPLPKDESPDTDVILTASQMPLLVEKPFGEGRFIYLLQPQIFNNRNIGKADNAVLAYNLAYHYAKGSAVYFDEGIRRHVSTWHVLFTPPFLWVTLQIILVTLLFVYAASKRFGPLRPLPIAPRRSKDEYVYALANLLMKKKNNKAILEIIKQDFLRWLNRVAGIPKTASEDQIIDNLHSRYQITPEISKSIFSNINSGKTLPEKEWLETINKIEQVMSQCTSRIR